MKGVSCIKFRKLFTILAVLFVPLFICLKNTNNTSALYDDINAPFTVYWRSYSIGVNGTPVNQSGAFTNSATSQTLLTYETGVWKDLYGFSIDFQINEPSNNWRYKSLNVKAELYQETWDEDTTSNSIQDHINDVLQHNSLSVNTSRGDQYVGNKCTIANMYTLNGGSNIFSYTLSCTINFSEYSDLYNAQIVLGTIQNATTSSPLIGYVCGDPTIGSCSASIQLRGISYTVSGTDDPSYRELQEISSAITEQNDRDSQDREDLNNQVDDSSDDADDAGAQITTGITPITTLIGNYVNIILHPPETDCSVNFDILFVPFHTGSYGSADLCSLNPPTAISVIGSLLIIGFIIPFAYSIFMFILKELQNFVGGA